MKNSNQYQGISHLMIIAFVPLLMAGAYFANSLLVRGIMIILLIILFVFIWKKIMVH